MANQENNKKNVNEPEKINEEELEAALAELKVSPIKRYWKKAVAFILTFISGVGAKALMDKLIKGGDDDDDDSAENDSTAE